MTNYTDFRNTVLTLLKQTKYAVLSTASKDGVVSASQMCIVSQGLHVFFQADKYFEKIKNIRENPNVALTIGRFYFKGTAHILGHPLTHPLFIRLMKKHHLLTYENYTALPNQILVKIKLTECRCWSLIKINQGTEETITVLDLVKSSIRQIKCDNLQGGY